MHWLLLSSVCLTPPEGWREVRARLAGTQPGAGNACNTQALRAQDQKLFNEYAQQGFWAHETSLPEPGGVLLALPIQAQLLRELKCGGQGGTLSHWAAALREQFVASEDDDGPIEKWLAPANFAPQDPMLFAYAWRRTSSMCNAALGNMMKGLPNVHERALWKTQCAALEARGRVCLVLEEQIDPSTMKCVVLNRQAASKCDHNFARKVLGSNAAGAKVDQLVEAFGDAPVYWGGPSELGSPEGPGLCLHGHSDLAGSAELAAGTHIYAANSVAGISAAAEAVLDGRADPLDFRLSFGHVSLPRAEAECHWMPVACSRSLVLKPCPAGLPEPLWREIAELCGGEAAELSRLVKEEEQGRKRNPNRPRGDSDI